MDLFCGLDVAIEETAVCVVDDRGGVHLTEKVAIEPEALLAGLKPFGRGCGASATRPARCRPGCIPTSRGSAYR